MINIKKILPLIVLAVLAAGIFPKVTEKDVTSDINKKNISAVKKISIANYRNDLRDLIENKKRQDR